MSCAARQPFEHIFEATTGWIESNLSRFEVQCHLDDPELLELLKPLGELALTASLLSKIAPENHRQFFEDVLHFCWREFGQGELVRTVLIERPDLIVLSAITGYFRPRWRNEALDFQLERMAGTPAYVLADIPAWRRLDLVHAFKKLGLTYPMSGEQVFQLTWLAGHHPPWTITHASAYGVTHTVFYMTDFGARPHELPLATRSYLVGALPLWLDLYLAEPHFDLASELVMVDCCAGLNGDLRRAGDILAHALLSDGSMPGPLEALMTFASSPADPPSRTFRENYHTTLVASMAAAMYLERVQ
jgi:hypothetical protein